MFGYYVPPKRIGNVFVVCLSVCPSLDIETSFLVWWNILTISSFDFEYQGHWVSVKVICWKVFIWLPGHQFNLLLHVYGQGHKLGQGQDGGGPLTEMYSRF